MVSRPVLVQIYIDNKGRKVSCDINLYNNVKNYDINSVESALIDGASIKNAILSNGHLKFVSSHGSFKDLTGQKFHEWICKEYLGNRMWLCKCSCGAYKAVSTASLTEGRSTNCGHERIGGKDNGVSSTTTTYW